MTFPINQNINQGVSQYQQPLTGAGDNGLIPIDNDKLIQNVNNSPVSRMAKSTKDNPLILVGLTGAIGTGLAYGMTKFNEACRGAKTIGADGVVAYDGVYENSIVGKIDEYGKKVESKPFFKSGAVTGARNGITKFKEFAHKWISKSKTLSSLFYTPSMPEFKMAIMMKKGTIGELANDATRFLDKYVAGADGKTPDLAKVKNLGFNTIEEYKKFTADPHTNQGIAKIKELCNRPELNKLKHDVTHFWKPLEKIPGFKKVFGREVAGSEIANKLEALSIDPNNKSLGKIMSKGSLRTLEGLTNGTAGGKFAILFQAYFIADALRKASHAPKGEKVKTFTEELFSNVGWYLMMPAGLKFMHSIGGLQYAGMGKGKESAQKALTEYRDKLKMFNAKTKGVDELGNKVEKFASYAEYKAALKDMKKAKWGNAKFYHRPFRAIGKILTVGLEKIRPYEGKDISKVNKLFQKTKFYLKEGAGWPMRLGVFMFVIAPFMSKIAAKVSHLIFGRPTHSILDEGKTEGKSEKVKPEQNQIIGAPGPQSAPLMAPTAQGQMNNHSMSQNQMGQPEMNPQTPPQQMNSQSMTQPNMAPVNQGFNPQMNPQAMNQPQQAPNNLNMKAPKQPEYRRTYSYVPGQQGVNIQTAANQPAQQQKNNEQTDKTMRKAGNAEQNALKYLGK